MGRLIDTSDLNNQIMLQKDRFGSLSVPICNIFEDMIRDTPTAKNDKPSGKWIPVTEIQNMRKEMSTISRVTDGERDILFTCLAMIDDLIEGYFEKQQGENT